MEPTQSFHDVYAKEFPYGIDVLETIPGYLYDRQWIHEWTEFTYRFFEHSEGSHRDGLCGTNLVMMAMMPMSQMFIAAGIGVLIDAAHDTTWQAFARSGIYEVNVSSKRMLCAPLLTLPVVRRTFDAKLDGSFFARPPKPAAAFPKLLDPPIALLPGRVFSARMLLRTQVREPVPVSWPVTLFFSGWHVRPLI